ncbi:hypothetical protein [Amycolatopsis balhimycina]|uniref:hypothetical protein n=1 Tax=Amycolatopsis balhimycina TaxID=208443 RepID=UPI0003A92266|nr:hypothetical protein [Amycolatopsis balhimycina]
MSITTERFALALKNLDSTQWRPFERMATVFLESEFPNIRPVSGLSGDGGADALLFSVEDDPSTIIQYSVRVDVSAKISETCKRIKETFPDVNVLVYVTNQPIDSKSVELRRSARANHGIHLDPRGIDWLISVRNMNSATMAEAEELARLVVDPLIAEPDDLIKRQAQALDDTEAKAAFVYLGLQWQDDTREKGLTKVCFEAIVRSVLRDTDSDNRLTRSQVYEMVSSLLPGHHERTMREQVDGALNRLNKKYLRHWQKVDEFCLTWAERVRLADRLTDLEVQDATLREHLTSALTTSASESGIEIDSRQLDTLIDSCRTMIESVLLSRGEAFAVAVSRDQGTDVRPADIEAVVSSVVTKSGKQPLLPVHVIAATLQSLLVSPPPDVRAYLRSLADTYTLFSFMRETPDVQSAVVKIFAEGDIWLDTSVVLPLFAEELLEDDQRAHSELLAAARECGLSLRVTDGVIEELATHVRRCRSYLRAMSREGAHGSMPFLFNSHRLAGKDDSDLENWLDNFCGKVDPEVDIAEYLLEEHGIDNEPLTDYVNRAPIELRAAVAEVWYENREHKERRQAALGIPAMDATTRDRLVNHDVENYVGIVVRRQERRENRSAFGYKSWWLTLDRTAFRIRDKIAGMIDGKAPATPAISPDFMLNYLAIGPVRKRAGQKTANLPLMLNMSVLDAVPEDLLALADELRAKLSDLPARVVRRKIRETLEDARRLLGPKGKAGEVGLSEEIKVKLIAAARAR